ncbi:hypothetical protein HF086_004380 [Spodoptera exigua]|uniref:Uncharacterized protein n=1 Tax=Spodoptera exigua TaxID=7107 RepID=A0A922SEN9_SPOEX|nr:hypothetical protein HF086_004380 [Spodoptera exigua]
MSKEGYSPEKKEGDNKVVLERLQNYLKDKRTSETSDPSLGFNKPSTSYDQSPQSLPTLEDSSNILREVLNHKKAELLRQPEIVEYLKSISSDLKK